MLASWWMALNEFPRELNHHHTTIKFTTNWSAKDVLFLDTRVYLLVKIPFCPYNQALQLKKFARNRRTSFTEQKTHLRRGYSVTDQEI